MNDPWKELEAAEIRVKNASGHCICICGEDHWQDERPPTRTPAQCKICKRWFHPYKYAPMCMPNEWVCDNCAKVA